MKAEILAPAGDWNCAVAALSSGADALYLGLNAFSARAGAENFDTEELEKIVTYAHLLSAKVYVCLNTLVKDDETDAFFESARSAWNAGADALLVQDLFLGKELKHRYPDMILHLSTQAGCCNEWGAHLAKEFGFSRVVLARETPIGDIRAVSAVMETEVFVQGALCSCFSGQCYLSSFAGNNSGNRGRCKQPCRKRYSIDRAGYESRAYALSLADLSVGERVRELLDAGVVSLKIEGRMRRPEYVSSAVGYYRALLDGQDARRELSDLKRSYNRGDYTKGLAFGQNGLLSRRVQGHIGEKVGTVRLRGGRYFCNGTAACGDGFKILRNGKEVGGAVCGGVQEDGFFLSTDRALQVGDEVRITTDAALASRLSERKRARKICLSLDFTAGKAPRIACGDFVMTGETALDRAKNAPLSVGELKSCFGKIDGLPLEVTFGAVETENAFLPKSALNALRRTFYEALLKRLLPAREQVEARTGETSVETVKGNKIAVITEKRKCDAEIVVHKPRDYTAIEPPEGRGEHYLYLPPQLTAEDETFVGRAVSAFDGIYCEGSYGIVLARKYGKRLFAGTGFNLTNRYAVNGVKEAGATYFTLSKELTAAEQRALSAEGAFALSLGDLKVMDLSYCPFERTCADCDKRTVYHLTDEDGRTFPLRRYQTSAAWCKFEVYNCAPLSAYNGRSNALVDLTVHNDLTLAERAFEADGAIRGSTTGHKNRSLQ